MELGFEFDQQLRAGRYPAAIHTPENMCQLFFRDDSGHLHAAYDETPSGMFYEMDFSDDFDMTFDTDIKHLSHYYYPGETFFMAWEFENKHRILARTLFQDAGGYLDSGSMDVPKDDPVASLSLTLDNPGFLFAAPEGGILSPGTKIELKFRVGNETMPMGVFYADRVQVDSVGETVSVDARNTIGHFLKDQHICQFTEGEVWRDSTIRDKLRSVLIYFGVSSFNIAEPQGLCGYNAPTPGPDVTGKEAVEKLTDPDNILGFEENYNEWIIKELADGTVVWAHQDDQDYFPPVGNYIFYRSQDVFSRQVTMDDEEVYSQVCVHCPEDDESNNPFDRVAYADVDHFVGWIIPQRKTKFIEVIEGTEQDELDDLAERAADSLADVGRIESFTGPIRPHLEPRDYVQFYGGYGVEYLGQITDVQHNFGKGGFTTEFTVDSGGNVGKPRLREYIKKLSG